MAGMVVGVAQNVFEVMRGAGVLRLGAILRHMQPSLDQMLVGLEVELQAVRAVTKTKRLVGTGRRTRQVHRARGKVEGIGMPLEHVLVAGEVTAQRVPAGGGRGMQWIPADL